VNSGTIAGGVVGGVVALALITGAAWFLIRRRRQVQAEEPPMYQRNWQLPAPPQEMEATYGRRLEAGSRPIHEVPAESHAIEMGVTSSRHMPTLTEYAE
jgi:hypothetical protein